MKEYLDTLSGDWEDVQIAELERLYAIKNRTLEDELKIFFWEHVEGEEEFEFIKGNGMTTKEFNERVIWLKDAVANYFIENQNLSDVDIAQDLFLELERIDSWTLFDNDLEHFESSYADDYKLQ